MKKWNSIFYFANHQKISVKISGNRASIPIKYLIYIYFDFIPSLGLKSRLPLIREFPCRVFLLYRSNRVDDQRLQYLFESTTIELRCKSVL